MVNNIDKVSNNIEVINDEVASETILNEDNENDDINQDISDTSNKEEKDEGDKSEDEPAELVTSKSSKRSDIKLVITRGYK